MSSAAVARLPSRSPRVSDAEREQAAGRLRRHFAAGRLSAEELEERVVRAYAARTRSELAPLLADLPRRPVRHLAANVDRAQRALFRAHAASYAAAGVGSVGVWELLGAGPFWPGFLLVPWGVAVGGHALGSRGASRRLGRLARERR